MQRAIAKLAMLVLSATIVPMVLAQDSQQAKHDSGQPATQLVAWTQSQRPEPVPSRQPVSLPDQQPEQRPDAQQPNQQPASRQQGDMQKQNATQTFAGTVMKSGEQYVLRTADNVTYQLDDQARAKKYEGKQVQVTGSLDENSGTIHVQDMKAAA